MFGAAIGAFGATWALRRARGQQAVSGRSCCDSCAAPLTYAETIPLISYAIQKGRCRRCAGSINPFHAWSEAGGALILAAIFLLRPWPMAGLEGALAMVLWCLALVDIKTLTLPNVGVVLAAVLSFALGWFGGFLWLNLAVAIIFGLCLTAIAYILKRLRGRTMLGSGDIKLIIALSFWLGPDMAIALALGSCMGLLHIRLKPSANGVIPFGPALMIATLITGLCVRPYFSLTVI